MQAACVQGTDPYMQQWAAPDLVDLESLPMQPGSHSKHHSPMEDSITDFGGDNPDYLKLLEVRLSPHHSAPSAESRVESNDTNARARAHALSGMWLAAACIADFSSA